MHRNTVSDWWQYQQEGEAAKEQQLRGKKLGEGGTLSVGETPEIQLDTQRARVNYIASIS